MYIRKTYDVYEIQGYYYLGWECVTYEDSLKDAKTQLKTYRDNEVGTIFRIIKRRVRKGGIN